MGNPIDHKKNQERRKRNWLHKSMTESKLYGQRIMQSPKNRKRQRLSKKELLESVDE